MISTILWVASLVCWLIIVIDAFKSSILKGILCLVTCGIYTIYYAFVEFKHEKKTLIILGWLLPTILAVVAGLMKV